MRDYLVSFTKAVSFLSVVLLMSSVKGATYYFSTKDGNDSRTASQAQHASTPWKTLKKLNSFFPSLKPGDIVLFKRGDTFYGSITISQSGTASSPIVLDAYGTGAKPVITGLVTLSGWTSLGGGIYECAANASFGSSVNMVLINNKVEPMGRYPNANAANSGYITYQSHVGQTSITGKNLPSSPNFTGGEVVIRPIRHVLDRCLITGHSGGKITYNKVTNYVPIDGYGFFIQNHIKTLDQFGEWYYNPKTKKISMYFGSAKPSSYTIQATAEDVFITGQSRNHVTFNNLMLKGANTNAFDFLGGSYIKISDCDILYAGVDGIFTQSTSYVTVTNTTVNWCNSDGIFLQASNTDVTNNQVTHCTVNNIGPSAGMGESGSSSYQGITVLGGKNTVAYNTIDNTGYVGIKFGFGDNIIIKNNYINNYCFIKNDGGGIYTWNNARDKNGDLNAKTYYGNQIIGNIVLNAGIADAGTIYSEKNVDHPTFGSHGIYCDENSQNMEISGNTVAYNGKGIFLHDNRNMTVENNTVFNNRERQMDVYYDDLTVPVVRNIVIKNNIFLSNNITQETAGFRSLYDDLGSFGTFDNNYYAQSINKGNSISSKYIKSGLDFINCYNLPGWKLAYSDDQHSKTEAASLTQYTLNASLSANKYSNGNYNSNITGTNSYNSGGTSVSSWVSGKLDGGAFKLSYKGKSTKSTTTNVIINVGAVSSTKNYILEYSVLGTKKNGTVGVYLRQGSSPYDQLTPIQYFPSTTSRSNNKVLFSFPMTESNSQLVFQFNDRDSTAYLDNIKLYQADVTITNPNNYVRFYYNSTSKNKTVTLDATYIDVKNTAYSGNITLDPYTSIVLMKKSATSLVSNSLISNSTTTNISTADVTTDNKSELKIVAFPNPAPREFNLIIQKGNINDMVEIDVFDMSGRNVYHVTGGVDKKYSFGGNFLPGVYMLKATQGKNSQTIRLIK